MKRCREESACLEMNTKKNKNQMDLKTFVGLFFMHDDRSKDTTGLMFSEKVNFVTNGDETSCEGPCDFCEKSTLLHDCDRCTRPVCRNCSTLVYMKEQTKARCLDCF
ncbi:hypothetical protein SPOG_05373 [Schizosaccharomyces cryophilus OY26]|uniref:Uncharacterized protein n=1 Tax=Schizosaccharomyces cryophilus (strain OY26 / ATCC MYA-4695 / CBS 11777 / NBRC 106824 / NRRL Y48691) TaxID=653667 RepID=S9VZD1_SCHCR|nr:uncharacterized protein SPOG_05373 [Schizosaccharomyces cryophilus OY26]EPY51549.1 hypothetical protein SPOG_05373 [Schizosaccharomyces cryophilus OY26]